MDLNAFETWVETGLLPDDTHDEDFPESWSELEWRCSRSGGLTPFGHLTVLETTGGMDQGSNASITFKVDDKYYRKSGYYASHYGYDWDGTLEEVEPYEEVVVRYRSV